jgi:hypothetical protein
MDKVLAWHFLPDDGRLRYGTHEAVRAGRCIVAMGQLSCVKTACMAARTLWTP